MPEETIDTTNDCLVGVRHDAIVIVNLGPLQRGMNKEVALRLAAFIVALADPTPDHAQFAKVLAAVENA